MKWPGGGGRSVPPGFPGGEPSPLPGDDHHEQDVEREQEREQDQLPLGPPAASRRRWRFGKRRDKEPPFEQPLLQTSYDDETVQDVIEVSCVEVLPLLPAKDEQIEARKVEARKVDDDPEPFEIDLTDDSDPGGDDDLAREEIDLTGRDARRSRRSWSLSVVWPGDSDRSVPPDFPGAHEASDSGGLGSVGLRTTDARTTGQHTGLRAVVAAVYAALADPLGADPAAREQRAQRVRKAGIVAGSTVLSAVLVYTVFPVRTYLDQRAATQRANEEIEVLSEANEKLAERAEDLRTPEVVEEKARADYGYVFPNEESYRVLPPPVVTTVPTTTTTIPPLP